MTLVSQELDFKNPLFVNEQFMSRVVVNSVSRTKNELLIAFDTSATRLEKALENQDLSAELLENLFQRNVKHNCFLTVKMMLTTVARESELI